MTPCTIPGPAVPFARPRPGGGHFYQLPSYAAWRASATLVLRAHASRLRCPRIDAGPVAVSVVAVHPRAAERPAWCPRAAWAPGGRVPAVTRMDLDNVVKAVLDALADAGVFADDRQVCRVQANSYYAATGEAPAVHVGWEAVAPG